MLVAGGGFAAACGSVSDSTECTLDKSCSGGGTGTDSGTHDTGGGSDTTPPDTRVCSPGDHKKVDCNECVCNASGEWECTNNDCPDTGPPPSPCPETANPGGACTGSPHCIYHTPCDFGCDCVAGLWLCGACPG